MKKNIIFFLFPVVGMYSFHLFHLFHPLFIFILSFLAHSLYKITHTSFPTQLEQCFISLSISLSTTTKKSKLAKKKREKENKKRIYNRIQHIYTHTLFPAHSLTLSLSTGRDRNISAQFSSAQLRHSNREKSAATLYFSFLSWL